MIKTERIEKMNELMNKISLSLKDANLQQGFEIICKRIAELEKENAYAKTIIQDLLSNSDEYARQRAIDFLKEK